MKSMIQNKNTGARNHETVRRRIAQPWDSFPGRTMLPPVAAPLNSNTPQPSANLTRPGRASPDQASLKPVSGKAHGKASLASPVACGMDAKIPVGRDWPIGIRAFASSRAARRPSSPVSCLLSPVAWRSAFTLIELLVVISIIAILISILLPALAHFRTEGYVTSTTEELTSVKAACLAYYAHFDAYPGLFPEADISAATSPTVGDVTDGTHVITGTQNMLLSMMGTAYTSTASFPSGTTTYATIKDSVSGTQVYVPYTLGTGPIDYANGSQQLNAFLTPTQAVLATQPPTTGNTAPTALPTLYDEFPSGVPILYWRQNPGAANNVPVGTNAATPPAADFWLNCNNSYFNNASLSAINGIVYDEKTTTSHYYSIYNDATNGPDALAYMVVNQTLDSTYSTTDPNTVGMPVQGKFVLESAGPDHIYGPQGIAVGSYTANITAAGQCDDIFVFGGQ